MRQFRTINTLSRYSIIVTQFILILMSWAGIAAIWARVEQVAIIAETAEKNAEQAARWANALADDARLR